MNVGLVVLVFNSFIHSRIDNQGLCAPTSFCSVCSFPFSHSSLPPLISLSVKFPLRQICFNICPNQLVYILMISFLPHLSKHMSFFTITVHFIFCIVPQVHISKLYRYFTFLYPMVHVSTP